MDEVGFFYRISSMIFDPCKDIAKRSSSYVKLPLKNLTSSNFQNDGNLVCGTNSVCYSALTSNENKCSEKNFFESKIYYNNNRYRTGNGNIVKRYTKVKKT